MKSKIIGIIKSFLIDEKSKIGIEVTKRIIIFNEKTRY